VTPRAFPPAPGWSPDGHRIKAHLEYGHGRDKLWVYGALRVQDGQVLTQTALARNTTGYLALLTAVAQANPAADLYLIADNLSSHTSRPIQDWLAEHPRMHPIPLPVGAAWLNLIEGWWRIFRRKACAGQDFANHQDLASATRLATHQLNHRARLWIWGRPPPPHRQLRRRFVYCL
jgi:hypothetical protein